MVAKNIAIFFDGTWNKPKTETNVFEGYDQLAQSETDSNGKQITKYIKGVGTEKLTLIRGGAFGVGIRNNIVEGYKFLAKHYKAGDRIYLIGFSRGAYTARSLAGMIVRYGLSKDTSKLSAEKVFKIYTQREKARQIVHLWKVPNSERTANETLIMDHSERVNIEFMGLWDTVGMIGVPNGDKFGLNSQHKFHHQNVSSLYQRIAHAVSINENRGLYKPTLFFKYAPDTISASKKKAELSVMQDRIEQRWFAGSHGCIGGSKGNKCERIPLAWVHNEAAKAGLLLKKAVNTNGIPADATYEDSFTKGFFGKLRSLLKRHHRPIGRGVMAHDGYTLTCLHETIDKSVFDRCRADAEYRPANLVAWAQRKGIDLAVAKGDKTA